MPPLKQLFTRSLSLLAAHPRLAAPPLILTLFLGLWLGTAGGDRMLLWVIGGLIHVAVTGGWLAMIVCAQKGDRPLWEHFFDGLGRHFWTLALGQANLVMLAIALALPLTFMAMAWIGPQDAQWLQGELTALSKRPTLEALDPKLVSLLVKAGGLALVWLAMVLVLHTVLLFWMQAAVILNVGWTHAWRRSIGLFRAHVGPLLVLLTIQGLFNGLAFGAGLLNAPLASQLLALATNVVFTIAYTLTFLDLVKTTDDNSPSPTGLPS